MNAILVEIELGSDVKKVLVEALLRRAIEWSDAQPWKAFQLDDGSGEISRFGQRIEVACKAVVEIETQIMTKWDESAATVKVPKLEAKNFKKRKKMPKK